MDNQEIPAETRAFLKKVVGDNLDDFSVSIEGDNKKGEGYLSERLKIAAQNKRTGKDLHILLKQCPYQSDLILYSYNQEIYFYEKVWPTFLSLLKTVPDLIKFNPVPEVLAIDSQSEIKKIAMENLVTSGFQLFNQKHFFHNEHAELIFKNYGTFHGLSFVLRNKHPDEFSKLIKPINENSKEIKKNTGFLAAAVPRLVARVRDNYNREKKNEVKEKLAKYVENGQQMYVNSKNYEGEYPIITHGDCWSNNFLFKYDASGKLVDMKILDFQFLQVGTSIQDLSYCFYSAASPELLDNLETYLKTYYESLSNILEKFGLDPTVLYPFNAFKNEWKQCCLFGYMSAILTWCGKLLIDSDEAPAVEDLEKGVANGVQIDWDKYDEITSYLTWHMFKHDFL